METVSVILLVLAGLAGLFLLELLVVGLWPGFAVPAQPLDPAPRRDDDQDEPAAGPEREVAFSVRGVTLRGRLYLPPGEGQPVPCVVMAHGAGGVAAMGLARYARRFQRDGLAVLAFDYRHWGESDGQPRHLLWIPRQFQDWSAALEHARTLPEVDPKRIALWGTSLSGGHVITTAARDGRAACVIAQCPGLDGRASAEMIRHDLGLGAVLRLVPHAQRDLLRSWLGLAPHYIPMVGAPGSVAMLTLGRALEAFGRVAPAGYRNRVCARIMVRIDKYRPVKFAGRVRCPTLLQICRDDEFTPATAAQKTAAALGGMAEVKHYPIKHFDIYFGRHFETSLTDQAEFLARHLGGDEPVPRA